MLTIKALLDNCLSIYHGDPNEHKSRTMNLPTSCAHTSVSASLWSPRTGLSTLCRVFQYPLCRGGSGRQLSAVSSSACHAPRGSPSSSVHPPVCAPCSSGERRGTRIAGTPGCPFRQLSQYLSFLSLNPSQSLLFPCSISLLLQPLSLSDSVLKFLHSLWTSLKM